MKYVEMLNKVIEESGLSNKEILHRMKEMGVEISANYLSIIKNNEDKIPSEEVSRAIAKACGAIDEDLLVFSAYLDKAPEIVVQIIDYLKLQTEDGMKMAIGPILQQQNNMSESEAKKLLEEMIRVHRESDLAEFLVEVKQSMGNNETDIPFRIEPKQKKYLLIESLGEVKVKEVELSPEKAELLMKG